MDGETPPVCETPLLAAWWWWTEQGHELDWTGLDWPGLDWTGLEWQSSLSVRALPVNLAEDGW